jgi:hypothetical protein
MGVLMISYRGDDGSFATNEMALVLPEVSQFNYIQSERVRLQSRVDELTEERNALQRKLDAISLILSPEVAQDYDDYDDYDACPWCGSYFCESECEDDDY